MLKPVGSFIGLLFIELNCKHYSSKPFMEPFEVNKPKFYTLIMMVWILLLLTGLLLNIYLLIPICYTNEADCLILTSNSILIFVGIWVTIQVLYNMPVWIRELNTWSHQLDELVKEATLFEHLTNFTVRFSRYIIVGRAIIVSQFFLLLLIAILSVSQRGLRFIIPETVLFIISFTEICSFMVITMVASIVKQIFKLNEIRFCQKLEIGKDVEMCIEDYKRSLWLASYTWREMNKAIKSSDVLCLICFIGTIILNVYSLILESDNSNPERLFVSCYRFFSIGIILVITMNALDQERIVSIILELFYIEH